MFRLLLRLTTTYRRQVLFSFCVLIIIFYWKILLMPKTANQVNFNQNKAVELRLLNPVLFANETDFKCQSVKISDLGFSMCLYTKEEDLFVSGAFLNGRYYEQDVVVKFIEFFKKHDDVTFVDLGANLGTYSLPISHLGRHVVAVEPNPDTYRRLSKSIHLGKIANTIDALNCAIADETFTSVINFDTKNRGDTFLVQNGSESCKDRCLTTLTTSLSSLIPVIRNSKAVMKVDTQGSEIKIFSRKGAAKFFETIDIPMIMMEWDMYQKRYGDTEEKRRVVDEFLEFFYQRGYDVYNPRTEKKLSTDWKLWSKDVLFKKKDLHSKKLFSLAD